MKVSQLDEKINDDIAVLSKIADLVLSWLPNTIPENDSIRFERLPTSHSIVKTILSKIPESHHNLVIELLTKTNYVFNNTEKHLNVSEVGVHVNDGRTMISSIVINLSALFNNYDAKTKNDIINARMVEKPFKSVKSILMHEMRHGQQYHNYGGNPNSDNFSYDRSPDEIDAAWLHHLVDYDVNDYNTAIDYVRSVMPSFEIYKILSDTQKKKYLKKTASYWYQHHNPTKIDVSPDEKLEINRNERIKKLLNDISNTTSVDGINDLRNYEGYPEDADNFLLPYDNLIKVTTNALTTDANYNDTMISYVYGFLAMLYSRFGIDFDIAKRVLKRKYSLTIDDAITNIKNGGFGKFNAEYFIQVMSNL